MTTPPDAHHLFSPAAPSRGTLASGQYELHVGLVNNMPDAALQQTEQQFSDLFASASWPRPLRLTLYALRSVPRSAPAHRHLAMRYQPIESLFDAAPDVLVVTGAEPKEKSLRSEPYWDEFARLVDWICAVGVPAMFSCLAAHAAVLHLSQIDREPLERKCIGLFDEEIRSDALPTGGAGRRMSLPHSRWNRLPTQALVDRGYRILSRSEAAGVGLFRGPFAKPLLLCQGHPEYEPSTLLREFKRDVRRFLRGERDTYPDLPAHYFDQPAVEQLAAYRARVISAPDAGLIAQFPADLSAGLAWGSWRIPASCLLRSWLDEVTERQPARPRVELQPSF